MEAGHYWPLPRGRVLGLMDAELEAAGSYLGKGVTSPQVGWVGLLDGMARARSRLGGIS